MALTFKYDKNTDYQSKKNQAVATGDLEAAAVAEQQRNAKIKGEKITSQQQTQDYASYLPESLKSTASGASSNAGSTAAVKSASSAATGYTPGSAPTYTSKYADQINSLTKQLMNSSYSNWQSGSDYAALKDQYTQSGQQAMQNTLGQVSARTGGLASSYATTAANQSYNNYMDQLTDAARSMYSDDYNRQSQQVQLLEALDQGDYAKYQDLLSQYNTDRSYNYGVSTDNRNYNYQTGRDAVSDAEYNQEYTDSRGDTAYQQKLNTAQTLAQYGDFSGYKALGYTDGQISNMRSKYQLAQVAKSSSGSSSGSSSKKQASSSGSTKPTLTAAQTLAAIKDGVTSDAVLKAYKYYYGEDYDTGESGGSNYSDIASTLSKMKSGGSSSSEILSALREAQNYLSSSEFQRLYSTYRGR